MKPLAIIKLGSTFPSIAARYGDFEDWILAGMKIARSRVRVVSIVDGKSIPAPDELAGAILTGSHSMVTDGEESLCKG